MVGFVLAAFIGAVGAVGFDRALNHLTPVAPVSYTEQAQAPLSASPTDTVASETSHQVDEIAIENLKIALPGAAEHVILHLIELLLHRTPPANPKDYQYLECVTAIKDEYNMKILGVLTPGATPLDPRGTRVWIEAELKTCAELLK
jgi:hypothetical protein